MFGREALIVIIAALVGAAIVLGVARWIRDRGGEPEDVTIGFLGPSLAALYLLVLAVSLATEWQTIGDASQAAGNEATAIRELYWSTDGLAPGPAAVLRADTVNYANAVIAHDWPQMRHNEVDDETARMLAQMNTYVLKLDPANASASAVQLDAISQIGNAESAREQRVSDAGSQLPLGLMTAVIVPSLVVAVFPFAGGLRTRGPGLALAAVQAALVTVGIVVVFQLNHPYSGPLSVGPAAMQSVLTQLTPAGS
jgi:Protein of unknown function (DUF4239)